MPRGTTRPSLCPSCRQLVGVGSTSCHNCGTSLTFSSTALAEAVRRFLPEDFPVTIALVGLNVLVFVLSIGLGMLYGEGPQLLMGGSRLAWQLGGAEAGSILHGEWWRLVVPMFLHGGIIHLAFNMLALVDLGKAVEGVYGSARFLFVYVLTGIVGFATSAGWSIIGGRPHVSIGASGAVLGIVGVLLAITRRRSGIHMEMVRAQLLRSLMYTFVLGAVVNVDNAAHVGGLAAGFLLGTWLEDRPPASARQRVVAAWMGGGAALSVAVSFAALIVARLLRGG